MELNRYDKFNLIPDSESFVDNIPIFATQQYADVLNEIKGYRTIWFEGISDSDIHYLIPFAVKKKGPFKKGMFLTATISLGKINTVNYKKEFLNELIAIIRKDKLCDWIQQCPNWAIFNTYPTGAIYAPFGTYIIDLQNNSEDDLFLNIHSKHKNVIRKAEKLGVTVEIGEKNLIEVYSLIKSTLNKGGISFETLSFFQNLSSNFKRSNLLIGCAKFNNMVNAAAVLFYNNYSAYYLYGGTIDKPFTGASNLLHWEIIKFLKMNGIKYYDLVGARIEPEKNSKAEGIQRFKSRFGSQLKIGYLWKMPISKTKYTLYIFVAKLLFILKGKKYKGDIIDQEIKRKA